MSVYDHLEFRHLTYIIAVAETGSFTAAAQTVHVAQSAISRQIGEIEDIFHVQIFQRVERKGRGKRKVHRIAKLTIAGESLLGFAHRLLDMREEIIEVVQGIEQSALRPFRLGFTPFVDPHVLETVTHAYRDLFPSGEIEPESGDTEVLVERLRKGEIDAALVTLPIASNGVAVQPVMHEKLVVCLRKDDPLAENETLAPEQLSGQLGIFSDPRHHPRAHARLLEMLAEQGITPRVSNPTFNAEHVQWMVKQHICLALIRERDPVDGELTTRPIRNVNWTVDSALIYKPEQRQMALPLLLRELERRFPVAGMQRSSGAEEDRQPTQGAFPFVGGPRKRDER
ncbi:MAG TPA: LysR family transcriptional regulator [Bryobacteraceae bacterium]|jgi:DNA-binding transcriptional LysR family regulator